MNDGSQIQISNPPADISIFETNSYNIQRRTYTILFEKYTGAFRIPTCQSQTFETISLLFYLYINNIGETSTVKIYHFIINQSQIVINRSFYKSN